MNSWALVLFVALWIITFIPAWKLLLRLLALSVSNRPVDTKFIILFVLYRAVIILPYAAFLVFGQQIPSLLSGLIIGFLSLFFVLSFIRFFLRRQVINLLWGTYSYVYDGLLNFYPYTNLISLVAGRVMTVGDIHVLDAGCGTGNLSRKLVEHNPGIKITAIDSSAKMAERARKKLNKYDNVEVYNLDVLDYFKQYPNEKFDAIILVNVLYAIDDRSQFWNQALSRLKKNGQLIITNSDREGSWPIVKEHLRHSKLSKLLRPNLLGVFIIDLFISQLAAAGRFHFLSQEELQKEIARAEGTVKDIQRCYGGGEKGVNLLFTVTATP